MSTEGIAFQSAASAVLEAWETYKAQKAEVRAKRDAMAVRFGRGLMVNRLGLGHGTTVVGFEQLTDDVPGELLGANGELRVPKRDEGTVVPNLRRKAGRDLDEELRTLTEKGPELPGMPAFSFAGLRVLAPAIHEDGDTLWVRWSDDITQGEAACGLRTQGGQVDAILWDLQPLSAYFASREAVEVSS